MNDKITPINPDPKPLDEIDKLDRESDFGYSVGAMDVEAFLNLRNWLQAAIETKGAVMEGAGIGGGEADIDFTLDGMDYNVTIKPRKKYHENQ